MLLFFTFFLYQTTCLAQAFFELKWKDSTKEGFSSQIFLSRDVFFAAMDSLKQSWHKQGYLLPTTKEILRVDTLLVQLYPGPVFQWKELKLEHIPEYLVKKLGPPGKRFAEPYFWMEKLIGICENSGYPFASVVLENFNIQENKLYGVFRFTEGPKILWDSLEISGQNKINRKFLQRYSGIIPGSTFSQTAFEKAVKKINRSPYFKLDSVPNLSFQIKSAKPTFSLLNRKINQFDGIVGLASDEKQSRPLFLTGEFNLALFHLGGRGRDISVYWQRPTIQSQYLELSAKKSQLFNSLLDFKINYTLLKQDSSFVNRVFKLELSYPIGENGGFRFFSSNQAGDLFAFNKSINDSPPLVDFRWTNYGLGYYWDGLDDPFFPRKGIKLEGEFKLGNKRILPNTKPSEKALAKFEASTTQIQGAFNVEQHVYINKFWGMWIRLKSGYLRNESLFLNELSRLGGLKSIRGFNEMFFYSDRFAFLNLEQRLFLSKESYLLAFGDFGWLTNPFSSIKNDFPRSLGLGLNLETDGGMFSFVLGMGQSNNQALSLSAARIHFGYSARF